VLLQELFLRLNDEISLRIHRRKLAFKCLHLFDLCSFSRPHQNLEFRLLVGSVQMCVGVKGLDTNEC
jgi:hypothetical protein